MPKNPTTARARPHPQLQVTVDGGTLARMERYRDRVFPGATIAGVIRALILKGLAAEEGA